jgi:chromatin remodeling complex protein RSC6
VTTKKDHVGLIYQYIANHVITTGLTIEPDENGKQVVSCLPVDEVVERLCIAFEKLNDRVKDW